MRTAPLAFALLLLPLAVPAGAADAEGNLLVSIRNDGEAIRARVEVLEGSRSHGAWDVELPRNGHASLPLDLPPARYRVDVTVREDGLTLTASHVSDSRGCEGTFQFAFRREGRVLSDDPDRTGCLDVPAEARALVEEARRALSARPLPASVSLPLPGEGDVGEVALWWRAGEPEWDSALSYRFRWEPAAFPDEWGREREGVSLRRLWSQGSSCGTLVYVEGVEQPFQVDTQGVVEEIRFPHGDPAPVAHSGADCFAEITVAGDGVRNRARGSLVLAYGDTLSACLHRHPLQGGTISPGDRLPSSFCAPWTAGLPGEWVAGAAREHRGFLAVPLDFLHESPDRLRVARLWLAEGFAYPLDAEMYEHAPPAPLERRAFRLAALAPEGPPLAADAPAPPPPPKVDLAPLHPIYGPSPGEEPLPFPLRDAVEAARNDPTLTSVRDVLARRDAALAGAVHFVRRDGDSPLATRNWHFLLAAPGAAHVAVTCARPEAASAALPAIRCVIPREPPLAARDLGTPPTGFGARDLPSLAAPWSLPLGRWRAEGDDASAGAPTHALYRAWDDEDGRVLEVGAGLTDGLVPVDAGRGARGSRMVVDLADGRSLRHESTAERTAEVLPAPQGLLPLREGPADLPRETATGGAPPALVGAGVGFGLLALLLLALLGPLKPVLTSLYTRLTRSDVLDSGSRSAILALVAAEPGIHGKGIVERMGRGNGLAEYHLGVLVREGFLTCVETKGFRRYFVTGRHSPREMRVRAALAEGEAERVWRVVADSPGIALTELAGRAEMSLPYASKTVKRLVEAGVLERRKEGRSLRLFPGADASALSERGDA